MSTTHPPAPTANSTVRKRRGARRRRRRAAAIALALCVSLLMIVAALAAPGDLDTTFNSTGKVVTPVGNTDDYAQAVALQPDGKLVAAGSSWNGANYDFALARYNSDGSLDTTFNSTGKVVTPVGSSNDIALAVAIEPDGKVVAAGYSFNSADYDFALVRYNSNGSLDTTFNTTGKAVTNIGSSHDYAQAVALQPDGKLVAAGSSWNGADYDFALARYNSDGALDTTFDTDGKVTTAVGNSSDYATAVVIQPDGKIAVAGYSLIGANLDFALVRYDSNGALDTTFNSTGKVITPIGSNDDYAYAVALQPDGKMVAAGSSSNGSNLDFALVRYNANGSLDTSFGSTGKVTTPIGSFEDNARAVAVEPDGKVVAAGYSYTGANYDFALARYQAFTVPNKTSNVDTDRQTDIAIWNPTNHNWYITDSTTNTTRVVVDWGNGDLGDKAVPGDYDGDNRTDVAVYRPSEGNWYVIQSSTNTVLLKNWGTSTDTPVPGDYDLDGKADTAIFRPTDGNWYILNSRDNSITVRGWGMNGDKPVPADYDGDGATDIAIYRPNEGNWYIITSKDRFARVINWGNSADKPVPADYDGDGRVDVAVYRSGVWFIRHWTNLVTVKGWGDASDTPVPADYDGDGKADIAVWRPSDLNWYILQSASNSARVATIPQPGVPVASAYVPQ